MGVKNTKSIREYDDVFGEQVLDINYFPSSVLLTIFSNIFDGNLPSTDYCTVSLVSKLWRQLALHSVKHIQLVPERLQHLLIPYKPQLLNTALTSIAKLLATSTSIAVLDLSNSEIDPFRARIIAEGIKRNSTVKHINLQSSCLDCDAAKVIADGLYANHAIVSINMSNNKIGASGALAIARALEKNKSIAIIDLSNNEIGNQGAIAISEVFKSKNRVKLNLSKNQIGGDGMVAIVKARRLSNGKTSFVYSSGVKFITVDGGKCILSK
eukprot:gene2537-2906_t